MIIKFEFVYRKYFSFQTFTGVELVKMYALTPVVSKSICLPPASINFMCVKIYQAETFLAFDNCDTEYLNLDKDALLDTTVCIRDYMRVLEPLKKVLTEDKSLSNSPLNEVQRTRLLELLNRFRMYVALDLSELVCTNIVKIDIELKPGADLPYPKPYPTNAVKREEIEGRVAEWKANNLVTETITPQASPRILLGKPDDSKRLIVDYRRLTLELPTIEVYLLLPCQTSHFDPPW